MSDARALQWPELRSRIVADYGAFRVRRTTARSPRTNEVRDFHVVERAHCVQIIAHDDAGRLILVEQYRPGVRRVTLEFPAGVLEAGEQPVAGALRELREETGYRATRGAILATADLDPAIESSVVHIVQVTGAAVPGERSQDAGEAVAVRLVADDEVEALIMRGELRHTAAVAAWFHYVSAARSAGGGHP